MEVRPKFVSGEKRGILILRSHITSMFYFFICKIKISIVIVQGYCKDE